jgi:hypothetical protein
MVHSHIHKLAHNRMIKGYRKYGVFNPKTDKRDLFREAIDELLDCRNYCDMLIQKLDLVRKKLPK